MMLFRDIEPQLAAKLKYLLNQAGENLLASQIDDLIIVERNDHKNGTNFFAVNKPKDSWDIGHSTLDISPGELHIDLIYEKIACIEFLRSISKI